jgi:formylglycine-generating enzyme required for sulfatase activity
MENDHNQKGRVSTMRLIAVIACVVLFLSGCSGDNGCKTDADCGTGFFCENKICKQKTDDDKGMLDIPAGSFMMGCNEAQDSACDADELPYHEVTLMAYKIDAHEVTQAQYQACIDGGGCFAPGADANCEWDPSTRADYPVVCVTWERADEYCRWAGKRLPSEAEWEKAARGDSGLVYPWGDSAPECAHVNFADCDTGSQPVGTHPGGNSPYGVEDMAGNVYEWVNDYYAEDYYATSPENDPQGPATGDYRVMRGGAWGYDASYLRTSNRGANQQTVYRFPLGFRCAK